MYSSCGVLTRPPEGLLALPGPAGSLIRWLLSGGRGAGLLKKGAHATRAKFQDIRGAVGDQLRARHNAELRGGDVCFFE